MQGCGRHSLPRPYTKESIGTSLQGRQARRSVCILVNLSIYGYNIVMKQVRIAQLKMRLSEYLREVRRGATISVLDRQTPIAHIVPIRAKPGLVVRKPPEGTPPPGRLKRAKAANLKVDIVRLLLEERQGSR